MEYTAAEIALMFNDEDPAIEIIQKGDWIEEGKWSFRSSIVKVEDKFYEIEQSRSGSYYTDYYYNDPEVYEVFPKEVVITKTVYERVK